MLDEGIDRRVRATLALALGIEVPKEVPFNRADTPAWDSFKHVQVIFMLEDEFGVQFSENEFHLLTSTDGITKLLVARLAS